MLNILNRIIVSILLIFVIVLLVAVAVTPEGVAGFLAFQLNGIHVDPISVDHLIIAVASLVVAALCAIVLRLQWRRGGPRSIRLLGASSTEVATESVVARLKQDVEGIHLVRSVTPTIHGRGKVVDVAMEVRTEPHVDVPAKAEEVEQVVRDSVTSLGLKLGKTRVKIVVGRGSGPPPVSAEM